MNETREGTVYVGYAGRPGAWKRFKVRRWVGLPAPVVAGFLAVLMFAGAALAVVYFTARARVDVTVSNNPELFWGAMTVENADGVIASATYGEPGPAVSSGNNTAPKFVQFGAKLELVISQAYKTGSFDITTSVFAPCNGGTNATSSASPTCTTMAPALKVAGLDLNGVGIFTATLVTGGVMVDDPLGPASGGSVYQAADLRKWKQFPVKIHVEILPDAIVGSSVTEVDGLRVTLV